MTAPGPRPDLCWLPVAQLAVDGRYQRDTGTKRSRRLIERIAADFRWARFGIVLVCQGDDDTPFLILDGQHRVEAARLCGQTEVPCSVILAAGVQDQAQAFLGANRDRVAVTPYALHHAMVVAGDETAGALDAICRAAGVSIPRYPVPASSMKPGQTMALGAIEQLYRRGGVLARLVLGALGEAYADKAGCIRAPLIHAAAEVLRGGHADRRDRLVAVLRRHSWLKLESLMLDFRVARPNTPARDALQSILLDLIAGRAPVVARLRKAV